MTAFFRDDRSLHARDAAAHDQNVFRRIGFAWIMLCRDIFKSRIRIDHAADAAALGAELRKTALSAGQAFSDLVRMAALRLFCPERIAEHLARKKDHIRLALRDRVFAHLRIAEFAHDADHSLFHTGLDRCGIGDPAAVGQPLRFCRITVRSLAHGTVDQVRTGFLAHLCDDTALFQGHAAFHFFAGGVFQRDDFTRSELFLSGADTLQKESRPVFRGTAVFVRPSICQRTEKFIEQIVMSRMEFDAVEPAAFDVSGARAHLIQEITDLFDCDRPRGICLAGHRVAAGFIRPCRDGLLSAVELGERDKAGMSDLGDDLRAERMHALDQFRPFGRNVWVVETRFSSALLAVGPVDRRDLRNDKTGSAFGAFQIMRDGFRRQRAFHGKIAGIHGRHADAVLQDDISHADGGKQMGIIRIHEKPPIQPGTSVLRRHKSPGV